MKAEPSYLQGTSAGVRLALAVQPRASRTGFGDRLGERRKLAITAPPVDGVAKSAVHIVLGETGKLKTVAIDGIALAEARRRLGE